jgi:HSP20 family protein
MAVLTRFEPFRAMTTLQDQINRVFSEALDRRGDESTLTAWAPPVDIYETESELVVKADLPDVDPKDLDIRVENNILTIRGERKFEKSVAEDNYLRVERSYGTFSRSFSLANTVNTESIRAEYSQAEADQSERGVFCQGDGCQRKVSANKGLDVKRRGWRGDQPLLLI